ncbi:TetR/AcrR family transcriptional regulator [Actinophytocola sp.]|uniref:TetR/AcrR family transcriptional regulator n=1 Tax=Actinophytocola sp. TaxID=1872138 RepID=UPI002D7ED61D|nr:TetR family transcriptional regulator [Actinophytocola sp.]HET9143242.1 TetR family transcriptional regulator [Actinophytocola sp.]
MASGTRERIMDVALRLFAAQGVAATPVTAIEAGAGLSAGSGSFYRHFRDKHELLSAVLDRELAKVAEDPITWVRSPSPQRPPETELAERLGAELAFLRRLLPMIAILMWERAGPNDLAGRVRQTMTARGIELGIADLLLQAPTPPVKDDPAAAATVLISAQLGYFLSTEYFGAPPGDVEADRFTAMLARLLVGRDLP